MATFSIRRSDIDRLLTSPSGPVATDLLNRGKAIKECAEAYVPVDTGDLEDSLFVELSSNSNALLVRVGSRIRYASYVEFGTYRTRAQPYLFPCLEHGTGSRYA